MQSAILMKYALDTTNIEKNLDKIKDKKLEQYSLRPTHLVCLVKIKQSPEGLNSTELSHICDIDKAFVSRITTYLIKEDLIKINEKFNDGRKYKHKYILTEKANVMMEDIIQSIVYAFSIVTENIPKEELMTFYRILNAFNDNIESAVDSVLN